MPTTDPTFGWRIPELGDAPDIAQAVPPLAADIAATLSPDLSDTVLWHYTATVTIDPTSGAFTVSFAGSTPPGWQWAQPPAVSLVHRHSTKPGSMRIFALNDATTTSVAGWVKTEAGVDAGAPFDVHLTLIGRIRKP